MKQISSMLKVMNKEELQELKFEVDVLLDKQNRSLNESLKKIDVCPYCGSSHFKKNGRSKSLKQRYLCCDSH